MRETWISRARAAVPRAAAVAVLMGLLAVAGAAARPSSAATTTIDIASTQSPAANVTATLSSTGQTTYVFYSLTLQSKSSWTHVTLSDSAPTVTLNSAPVANSGAAVVFTDCPGATLSGGGFSCNIDKLAPSTPQTFDVVVQTPTSGDTLAVDPTVAGDERTNDQNVSKPDTFPTVLSWNLTSVTTNALTSYTNPALTTGAASFFTNKALCAGTACATQNPQWTQADVPNGLESLGTLVSLQERNFNAGECPAFVTSAGGKCFGQVSQISVGGSGLTSVFTSSPLGFTVRVAAASLSFKVDPHKVFLLHDPGSGYEKVPFCSTGHTDSTGDCTVSVIQDSLTHDIIWNAHGPSNGSWGGVLGH